MGWPLGGDGEREGEPTIPLAQIVELVRAVDQSRAANPPPYPRNQPDGGRNVAEDLPSKAVAFIREPGMYLISAACVCITSDGGASSGTFAITCTPVTGMSNPSTSGSVNLTSVGSNFVLAPVMVYLQAGTVRVVPWGGTYGAATYDWSFSLLKLQGGR